MPRCYSLRPASECVGGTYEIRPEDLPLRYESQCDPRLNLGQAMDVAFELAELYSGPARDTGRDTHPMN